MVSIYAKYLGNSATYGACGACYDYPELFLSRTWETDTAVEKDLCAVKGIMEARVCVGS